LFEVEMDEMDEMEEKRDEMEGTTVNLIVARIPSKLKDKTFSGKEDIHEYVRETISSIGKLQAITLYAALHAVILEQERLLCYVLDLDDEDIAEHKLIAMQENAGFVQCLTALYRNISRMVHFKSLEYEGFKDREKEKRDELIEWGFYEVNKE